MVQSSSGALIKRLNLSRTADIIVGFASVAWASEIIRTNGTTSASSWRVLTRIDLSKNYPINSSPGMKSILFRCILCLLFLSCANLVTGSLPIIRVVEGRQAVIQIPAADWDTTNDIRCRWASASGSAGNECGDVCNNLVTAVLSSRYCLRTMHDVVFNKLLFLFVAIVRLLGWQFEDQQIFHLVVHPVPTLLLSWPKILIQQRIQSHSVQFHYKCMNFSILENDRVMYVYESFLYYLKRVIVTYPNPSGACSIAPAVIGDRPNRACIGR